MGNTLAANHKIPKKTSAEWERLNPIIFEKELIAVETTNTGIRFKIGDGIRRYNQLPFIDEALYSTLSAKADKSYVEELISEIDVHGDIAIHNADPNAHHDLFENKVDKVDGKSLSTNDYTDEDKEKVNSALHEDDLDGYATERYVDDAIANIPIPDVSEQIAEHNTSNDAHEELFDKKVDKVDGKELSSNDFTDELKAKLERLPEDGGGIPDAPADGKQYARQDGAWTEVQGGGGGTAYTQAQILKLLVETDMIPTPISESGEVLIDDNNIVIIY